MKIGIMIAITREMEAFLKTGESIREESLAGRQFYHTEMEGHEITAVLSGYGEIDAAAVTALLIASGCEVIMNFGVVGALREDLRVNDLFVVEKVRNYGFDISPIDPVVPNQYLEYPDPFIPMDPGLLRLAEETVPGIRPVTAASGDRFVENREDKLRLRDLGCDICDMEVAAIARICERGGVRAVSVKCISDTFDGDGRDFDRNVRAAAERAFRAIRAMLKAL